MEKHEETAVLTEGMTIKGNIKVRDLKAIKAKIMGNINSLYQVEIKQRSEVVGIISGKNLVISESHIIGDLRAEDTLIIKDKAYIEGNIYAKNIKVSGAVNGDIKCERLILNKQACVVGKMNAQAIHVEAGARIKGEYLVNNKKGYI